MRGMKERTPQYSTVLNIFKTTDMVQKIEKSEFNS